MYRSLHTANIIYHRGVRELFVTTQVSITITQTDKNRVVAVNLGRTRCIFPTDTPEPGSTHESVSPKANARIPPIFFDVKNPMSSHFKTDRECGILRARPLMRADLNGGESVGSWIISQLSLWLPESDEINTWFVSVNSLSLLRTADVTFHRRALSSSSPLNTGQPPSSSPRRQGGAGGCGCLCPLTLFRLISDGTSAHLMHYPLMVQI